MSIYSFCFTISGETIEEFDQKYERVKGLLASFENPGSVAAGAKAVTLEAAVAQPAEVYGRSPMGVPPGAPVQPTARRPGRPRKVDVSEAAAVTSPMPDAPAAVPVAAPAPEAPASTTSKHDAVQALTELHTAKGEIESKKILKTLGVDRFSKIDPRDYGKLVTACRAAMRSGATDAEETGVFA